MKTLYIDCRSGASGDMTLGAMLSLGVPLGVLEEGLASLGLNEFELTVRNKEYKGSPVTDVDVILYNKEHAWIHPYSGKFRNYGQIKEMIGSSGLSGRVQALGRRIFDIKAAAESVAHGVPVDEVQFHEVGAVDSIVDIVGTAICVDHVGADRVLSRIVPTGFGTVECACGTLPVPAPAVCAIMEQTGLPHVRGQIEQELLTPTGAAILAGIVDEFLEDGEFDRAWEAALAKAGPVSVGRGTGKRDTGLPPLTMMLTEA
ncbi:MAG: LarC family nickel insertion protein [Firmicutes bacterium]|nr:LarC family nickel insertion protein [Bacillota bacterium]